jgi:hypothetical protein
LPSLIIITDSFPAANGGGISQTLYNLFDNWKAPIYVLTQPADKQPEGPVLQATSLGYQFENFRSYGNRWLKRFNPAIARANFNRQEKLQSLPADWPLPQQAWVLLSTTEPIKLHFGSLLQHRFGYTVVPYFMDDWMGGIELKWKGGSLHKIIESLLHKAPCRMMISRNLNEALVKRYNLEKSPTLIVHNPAPLNSLKVEESTGEDITLTKQNCLTEKVLNIIYAGSIWSMHFDALKAVAKAVQLLALRQAQGDKDDCQAEPVEALNYMLVIYTSEAAWKHNRKALEGPGVVYGGFVPYEQMPLLLSKAWLLLVTASFDPRYAPFTNSSVQTKITDYMAAGKPLLYVGPVDGASGQFIHEWDCGWSIGTAAPEDIAEQLIAISRLHQQNLKKVNNSGVAIENYLNKTSVQERLYRFIREYCTPNNLV